MAGDVPTYISRAPAPQPGNLEVRPQRIPAVTGGARAGDAVAAFGEAGVRLAGHIANAHEETRLNQAKADYLARLDELEGRFIKDTDFQTAPARFEQEHSALREDILAGRAGPSASGLGGAPARIPFSEAAHAKLDASLTTYGTVATRRLRNVAYAREADANVAALETESGALMRNASAAASPTERQASRDQFVALVESNASAGWITREAAQRRIEKFDGDLEKGDVARLVRENPAQARSLLSDARNFPNLDPVERERALAAAEVGHDTRRTLELGAKARYAPEAVSLELDRLADPAHAERIFRTSIVPAESGGRHDAVSSKGALGAAQLMPDTAREMAAKAGRKDIAGLSDADLKKLLTSPEGRALNEKLGQAYFTELLTRYEGRVSLAIAAYNAGPTRADEWSKKAVAKFGENFTPAQLAGVVHIGETRDYLGKIYRSAGAGMDGAGLSPNGIYRAAEHIRTEIGQDEAARRSAARDLAAAARAADDPAELFREGFAVDPERVRTYRTAQEQAAAAGDRSAVEALQKLDHWEAMAPYVRQAYSMPPALLQAAVDGMESELARSPAVTLEQKRRLDAFRSVAEEVEKRKDTDPVSLGERAFHWQTIDLSPAGSSASGLGSGGGAIAWADPQFRAALVARSRQAERAADIYGGAVKPFKPAEAEALKQRYSDMPEGERFAFIGALAETMPERSFRAALGQVGASSLDVTAGILGRGRPELARRILHGGALLKTDAVKPKADDLRAALAGKVKGELYPDTRMQAAVIEAALAVYAADRGNNGALYDAGDAGSLARALEQVTGPITARNGVRVPVYHGLTAATFEDVLDNLDAGAVASQGGAFDRSGQPFDPGALGSRAILKPLEPGSPRYVVGMPDPNARDGFAPVLNVEGAPLVFDMRVLALRRAASRTALDDAARSTEQGAP